MLKYCAPRVESTALNQGRLTSGLYSSGWSGWGKIKDRGQRIGGKNFFGQVARSGKSYKQEFI